jgi:hypothetical protein
VVCGWCVCARGLVVCADGRNSFSERNDVVCVLKGGWCVCVCTRLGGVWRCAGQCVWRGWGE